MGPLPGNTRVESYVPQSLLDDLKAQKRLFPSVKTQEEKGALCLAFCGGAFTRPVMGRLTEGPAGRISVR